jgi:RimJ/RimL family protein N-acetyltransferase
MHAMGHPWPLFDLRLRTPRLELRLPTDDDLLALVRLARHGVHDLPRTPFIVPWDEPPSPAFERQFLLHWWRTRGSWSPEAWTLGLVAVADGEVVGIQDIAARAFGTTRTVLTGSWLGLAHHRRGYGTEMRAAVLWLAFEELGALAADSGFAEGNAASEGVSSKLGYVANGVRILDARPGRERTERMVRVTPGTWRRDLVPVTVEGIDACRGLFGERDLPPDAWTSF